MKPFNLAESKIAERNYCKEHLRGRLRVAVMLVVLMLIVAVASGACKILVAGKATQVKSQLAEAQVKCIRIKRQFSEIEAKSKQREWQKQLADGSKIWLGVLNSVLGCVPPNLWLRSIESMPESSSVSIEGHAADFQSLSDFIGRLRGVSGFSEVQMSSSKVSRTEKSAFIDFALSIKLKNGGSGQGTSQPVAQSNQVPRVAGSQ